MCDTTGIGQRMRKARKAAGLTQEQLWKKCGFSHITIKRYESGKGEPSVIKLNLIADVLGVDLGWLVRGRNSNDSEIASIYQSLSPDKQKKLLELVKIITSDWL